jgi:peptidoglycan-N-acetylglucosamine deacetylase
LQKVVLGVSGKLGIQYLARGIARFFPGAVFCRETTEKVIALTFDDGPAVDDPASLHVILNALANHNHPIANPENQAKATFFLISSHVTEAAEKVITDLVAQGHEVGNHGVRDEPHAVLFRERFAQQFQEAHERLTTLTDQPIRWYRPGWGIYHRQMRETLLQTAGYEPRVALASILPIDPFPLFYNPTFTLTYVKRHLFPGAILVLHCGSAAHTRRTATVLQSLLPYLREQGYRVCTLSELVATSTSIVGRAEQLDD